MSDLSCCVCHKTWAATSPGISYRSLDGRWWCASAADCGRRLARAKARQDLLFTRVISLLAHMLDGGPDAYLDEVAP